jgi:CTP-dependent riboflavin kinase
MAWRRHQRGVMAWRQHISSIENVAYRVSKIMAKRKLASSMANRKRKHGENESGVAKQINNEGEISSIWRNGVAKNEAKKNNGNKWREIMARKNEKWRNINGSVS